MPSTITDYHAMFQQVIGNTFKNVFWNIYFGKCHHCLGTAVLYGHVQHVQTVLDVCCVYCVV